MEDLFERAARVAGIPEGERAHVILIARRRCDGGTCEEVASEMHEILMEGRADAPKPV